MAFSSVVLEVRIGNVHSRLVVDEGEMPRQLLDDRLNPRLGPQREGASAADRALVYDPGRDLVLTGALPALKRLLRSNGIRYRLREGRRVARSVPGWTLRPEHSLRPYQQEVVAAAIRRGHGLIDIGTGGGKTLLAAAICSRLSLPTLYLVTTRTLLAQAVASLRTYFGREPGVIGDGERRPEDVTVALIQALEAGKVPLDRWHGGLLIFDEGHHAAAATFLDAIGRIAPRYHFYLSAVPERSGSDQAVLDALTAGSLTGGKYSAQFLIEHGYASPVEARFVRCRIDGQMAETPFAQLYRRFVVENVERNALVTEAIRTEISRDRSVLVLVDQVRHGELLAGELPGLAAFVHGGTPKGDLSALTARFSAGSLRCLVATAGLFQEGISIDGIHVLVQAGGLKSRVKVLQAVGRGMRRAPGKTACRYLDFFDDDAAGIFRAHSLQRMRVLKEEGFVVPPVADERSIRPESSELQPAWAHVVGTDRFVYVDADGRVTKRGKCVEKSVVPERYCKRCTRFWCAKGGEVTWQDDRA